MYYIYRIPHFKKDKFMGIRIGPYDPIQLTFSLINALLKKNALTHEEAREIIMNSLPEDMSMEDKNKLVDSLFVKQTN